jgi:hypothetical protein
MDMAEPASTMKTLRKIVIWITVTLVIILVIVLPVVIVTGMFGGAPFASTVALLGVILLAYGVAWYTRSHGGRF